MIREAINVHATVIVAGTTGLLFYGPSGTGKSSLAFRCLVEAIMSGNHAALIADDGVFLTRGGGRIIATRPDAIRGLIELRHAGIGRVPSQRAAVIDYAILAVDETADRLPPEDENVTLAPGFELPLLRLPLSTTTPLALLEAILGKQIGRMRPHGH